MSSFNHNYPFFFIIFLTEFVLLFISSAPAPVSDSPYDRFIDFLSKNNCSMPKEVELPFPQSSDPSPFSYLSAPLKECRTLDALKENDEANLLCREVFDVLQNITCLENSELPSQIDSNHLSDNICSDFKTMRDVFPKRTDYLSGKLVDDIICKLLCTTEKYELLCKTLLWSYDTQTKIETAFKNGVKENEKESVSAVASEKAALKNGVKENKKGSISAVASEKATSTTKVSLVQNVSESNNQEMNSKDADKPISSDNTYPNDKNSLDGTDLNNSELGLLNGKISNNLDERNTQTSSDKTDSSTSKNQNGSVNKIANIPESIKVVVRLRNESEADNQKLPQEVVSKNIKPIEPNGLTNLNHQDNDHEKNEINVDEQTVKLITNNVAQVSSDIKPTNLTSNSYEIKDSKNISEGTLQNKDNLNSDISTKTSGKSDESVAPIAKTDNEGNNVKPQEEENESKNKQIDVEPHDDEDKKVEKPKLTGSETSNEALPDIVSKLAESSTLQILSDDDDEQHQEDKDQEQYNNSFNPPPKNTEPGVKSSIIAGSSQISNNYDTFISTRNNIGRVPDDIPVIPSFPEQEDSHFFFYFLSIVLILMAGYLIFHNKQKIIALIVEGRHERRRRSHGAGYKKLETK